MADEPKKEPIEDIESILSDLDAILSDAGSDVLSPAKPAEPPKSELPAPKPIELPKPVAAPRPVEPPKPIELPKPAETPKPPRIELAPREGMIKPPEKKPEPPKPAPKLPMQSGIELSAGPAITPPPPAPLKPADAPKAPQAPGAVEPAKAAGTAKAAELPPDASNERVRRTAYIYTASCSEVKTTLAAFLNQTARTVSKKPLFLREVLSLEVDASTDPNAVVAKARQAKAVAILAVVEGWSQAKVREFSDACSRASLLFHAVAPADAQKKSTAVDVIVDMMLLPGEG